MCEMPHVCLSVCLSVIRTNLMLVRMTRKVTRAALLVFCITLYSSAIKQVNEEKKEFRNGTCMATCRALFVQSGVYETLSVRL